ncbi:MAG: 5-demethoxyubiquinol-8 5-hydroxylase UbiM [Neisseria sp.]|uniref:5-demethoxyubiquinol-8 5-hydroxylase UbiM n=1 Tax=Neisseria sp. TaxID=192066 RepID=UPI0026DAF3A8|nr:5-demethoxyubiquinol-8 5-hydroxylase UbiM [Neisseria sp.]MDO4642078.1 5-demethoxyubiquinol-8 5-hydroxylase UbiM [Neisseria sp.]
MTSTRSDIIIVGAGPAGLSFARTLAGSGLRLTIVEKSPLPSIQDPAYDGREIALTHLSKEIMEKLGIWQRIPAEAIYRLKDAKVWNGDSAYQLYFPQPSQARGGKTDRLGNLVSNHHIRKAAYEAVAEQDNTEILCSTGVKEAQTNETEASVVLDNGQTLTAPLLIAADSRFSQTRRQLGIAADMHDFGRSVIVCRFKHEQSNGHTAVEYFQYGRTLALLPLEEHLTNCVITIDNDRAAEILSLSPEAFAASIEAQLKGKLGKMEVAGTTHTYPLVGVHANKFHTVRAALIGDAAVGMHPVTAHGFNLGLESADILGKLVLEAAQKGQDIGSTALLERYNAKHQLNTRPLYHGTNAMVRLFTNETPPAKLLRGFVLRVSNNLPPLKKLITRQLTG